MHIQVVDGSTGVAYKTEVAPEQTVASLLCVLALPVTPQIHIILPDSRLVLLSPQERLATLLTQEAAETEITLFVVEPASAGGLTWDQIVAGLGALASGITLIDHLTRWARSMQRRLGPRAKPEAARIITIVLSQPSWSSDELATRCSISRTAARRLLKHLNYRYDASSRRYLSPPGGPTLRAILDRARGSRQPSQVADDRVAD